VNSNTKEDENFFQSFPGAPLRINPSRIINLIDFYLAPRLAACSQQHAARDLMGA